MAEALLHADASSAQKEATLQLIAALKIADRPEDRNAALERAEQSLAYNNKDPWERYKNEIAKELHDYPVFSWDTQAVYESQNRWKKSLLLRNDDVSRSMVLNMSEPFIMEDGAYYRFDYEDTQKYVMTVPVAYPETVLLTDFEKYLKFSTYTNSLKVPQTLKSLISVGKKRGLQINQLIDLIFQTVRRYLPHSMIQLENADEVSQFDAILSLIDFQSSRNQAIISLLKIQRRYDDNLPAVGWKILGCLAEIVSHDLMDKEARETTKIIERETLRLFKYIVSNETFTNYKKYVREKKLQFKETLSFTQHMNVFVKLEAQNVSFRIKVGQTLSLANSELNLSLFLAQLSQNTGDTFASEHDFVIETDEYEHLAAQIENNLELYTISADNPRAQGASQPNLPRTSYGLRARNDQGKARTNLRPTNTNNQFKFGTGIYENVPRDSLVNPPMNDPKPSFVTHGNVPNYNQPPTNHHYEVLNEDDKSMTSFGSEQAAGGARAGVPVTSTPAATQRITPAAKRPRVMMDTSNSESQYFSPVRSPKTSVRQIPAKTDTKRAESASRGQSAERTATAEPRRATTPEATDRKPRSRSKGNNVRLLRKSPGSGRYRPVSGGRFKLSSGNRAVEFKVEKDKTCQLCGLHPVSPLDPTCSVLGVHVVMTTEECSICAQYGVLAKHAEKDCYRQRPLSKQEQSLIDEVFCVVPATSDQPDSE